MSDLRPWLTNYPKGVPANIDPDSYPNINAYLNECLEKFAANSAYECMGKSITYAELDEKSKAFAGYLHLRGLKTGDRVALMTPNVLQFPIAALGVIRAGMVLVNTNPLYTAREMEHQFCDSGAKGIIILENFASKLEGILDNTELETVIVTSVGELLGAVKGKVVDIMVRKVKRMVPKFNIPNSVSFSEALKQGTKFKVKEFDDQPDRVVCFQYTGGTTGVSKGAMLTNRNLVSNALQFKSWLGGVLVDNQEQNLCPLPLYHSFAFMVCCFCMPGIGANTVLITNARELGTVIEAMKKKKISVMTGVNTLFNALLNHKEFDNIDFSTLKCTVGGGMAVQTKIAEDWKERTGCGLVEGYGLTETSPIACVNPIDGTHQLGTIGMPVPSTSLRIIDDNGEPLGVGLVGEIQIQGPQVMAGYYNDPDKTAKTLKEGWLCTGDIGLMKEDGFFKIVDRKKDMILVSGFNVFPNEIEDVACMHPKVLECAAIGIPDGKGSELVKLFVVKKEKSLTDEEIIQHCRENLTGYKVPKMIEYRKELPKSNVGKILRRMLKEE